MINWVASLFMSTVTNRGYGIKGYRKHTVNVCIVKCVMVLFKDTIIFIWKLEKVRKDIQILCATSFFTGKVSTFLEIQ